jgi:hypothetical protein
MRDGCLAKTAVESVGAGGGTAAQHNPPNPKHYTAHAPS